MSVSTLLVCALLTLLTHLVAGSSHFFQLPQHKTSKTPSLILFVAIAFAIYLAMSLMVAPLVAHLMGLHLSNSPVKLISYLQFLIFGSTALLFLTLAMTNRTVMRPIWKDSTTTLRKDFSMGVLMWLISFPAVLLINQLADLFIFFVFHIENYEQVAVRFLKTTLESPTLLIMAMISILVFAPFIEEFLFRGLLQTWVKQKIGRKAAILISSFVFAFFHLATSQGVGNISLFISLFTLGCYLGFIYEKQNSLMASIALHFTFNAVSTLRIILD